MSNVEAVSAHVLKVTDAELLAKAVVTQAGGAQECNSLNFKRRVSWSNNGRYGREREENLSRLVRHADKFGEHCVLLQEVGWY